MVRPAGEWPQSSRPVRSNPPVGTVGIVMPIRDNLKFFKLAFHSILDFTDQRYMLTIVDNMSGFTTRQYLESIRRNHQVNVLQYQKPHNLAAEWNLGLRFMLAFANVQHVVCATPSIVVEPGWLSKLVRALAPEDVGAVQPLSNLSDHKTAVGALETSCLAISRATYERLGGFDEQLGQDCCVAQDFGDRARKAGLRLLCASEVTIHAYARFGWRSEAGDPAPVEVQA